ncbi:MAG: hypothetical protein R6V02_01940 [Candidatus Aminicenantes bacterium]
MSDYIYSSISKPRGEVTRHIQSIYHRDPPEVYEFHGEWGSLGVSRNLYSGFQPLETERHIFVVIGGPVLCFRDNLFLTGNDPVAGTQAIYDRWQSGAIRWDEDLSGPFAVLVVDKYSGQISCITDLMLFIPVYQYTQNGLLALGTHVDALAKVTGQARELDLVSIVDFILNDVVTYPYTVYKNIRQCHPAAVYEYGRSGNECRVKEPSIYWLPKETNPYTNIKEAAGLLRNGLKEYIKQVTAGMSHVAQFLSGGEDSRVIAGLLPQRLKRDAFIFLDSMNREGRIAQKSAHAYGCSFKVGYRSKTHYVDILPEASDLIGSGYKYTHTHSLGFHVTCGLEQYSAVFGGYLSDTFLKGFYARKLRGQGKFPFLPQIFIKGETRSKAISSKVFLSKILSLTHQRHQARLDRVMALRVETAHEWFRIWPRTMGNAIPYFYSNRRLFRTYEPFMCKHAVKISAAVPTSWKLNHRLFNLAFRRFLKPSRWILNTDGKLPYFLWWVNSPVQFIILLERHFKFLLEGTKDNQGPWCDWNKVRGSEKWQKTISKYSKGFGRIRDTAISVCTEQMFEKSILKQNQQVNLLQVLYTLNRDN